MYTRTGWYYNTSNFAVPVGEKLLYTKQRIHTNHPDFNKIDNYYMINRYLTPEADIPYGTVGMYTDFDGEIPKDKPKEEVPAVEETPAPELSSPVEETPTEAPEQTQEQSEKTSEEDPVSPELPPPVEEVKEINMTKGAKALVDEKGITDEDLKKITPTGQNGSITKTDVETYLKTLEDNK